MEKQISPLIVQIKEVETQNNLKEVKQIIEHETGMRITYQNVINHLIKKYFEEK